MKLEGKVVIVTGAAQGIGQAVAVRLAEEGADLALVDLNLNGLNNTAKQIREIGRQAQVFLADVSDKKAVIDFHKKTSETFGRIDGLVNNAGIFSRGPFIETSENDWDVMMAITLKGTMLCSQESIRFMLANGIQGAIVNLASISSYVGYSESAAYCTAKGGIVMLTKVLAREFGSSGIRVNAVAPGVIDTPMNTWFLSDENSYNNTLSHIPLNYIGSPKAVADAISFLITDDSRYITGTILPVDGGYLTH